jgi:hypothetical protein
MKRTMLIPALMLTAACASAAQTATVEDWVGIWHANVDGQPTSTLTLATDTGKLGGTVVLDMVSDRSGTPQVIASWPHVLINPHVDGNTLTFQVRITEMNRPNPVATFEVTLTPEGKARIHCTTCGADAPVVELTKGL